VIGATRIAHGLRAEKAEEGEQAGVWPNHVTWALRAELVLLAGFTVGWEVSGGKPAGWAQYCLLAVTAAAMFTLAAGKARTGGALDNPVLRTEGRVTMIDGVLAVAVLLGLTLNAGLGWWWADPAAGYVLVFYAAREVREIFFSGPGQALKT